MHIQLITAKKIREKSIHENSGSGRPWDELDAEKQSDKERRAKRRLNRDAVNCMTWEMLNQRDGAEEVMGWLMQIKQHLLRT